MSDMGSEDMEEERGPFLGVMFSLYILICRHLTITECRIKPSIETMETEMAPGLQRKQLQGILARSKLWGVSFYCHINIRGS